MALTQGSPLPDVTRTTTVQQNAPDWYTNYLQSSANALSSAAPSFVGAQGNQQQAFNLASSAAGNWSPDLQAATNLVNKSTGMSAAGAASPFIGAATGKSAAGAFAPFAQKAGALSAFGAAQPGLTQAGGNVYDIVGNYMNPYTEEVVNEIGRLGQENITRNLAPAAVSGAAGTGQFGSRRGAQVLGNVIQDALSDVSGKQSQALFTGYDQATKAAQTDLARQLQAAVAAGQMTDADAARILQAGTTAGQLTDADVGRLLQSGELAGKFTGLDMANLMTGADLSRNLGIARGALTTQDISNLAKTGEQQRAIEMERQMFPLMVEQQKLNALRGMQIPMGQTTTVVGPEPGAYGASPLSSVAGIGTMLGQVFGDRNTSAATNIGNLISRGVGGLTSLFSGSDSSTYGSDWYDPGFDYSNWGQP